MRDVLAVFFRQSRVIIISFVGTLMAVLLYTLITPSYQAHMKVLVRRGRMDPVMTPTPTQPLVVERPEVTEEELNSEVELLRDDQILLRVARDAGLVEPSRFWDFRDNEEVRLARAASSLAKNLTVEPLRKTALIAVSYRSSDAEKAARVLQCLADAYLQRHVQLRRPSGESAFFEEQLQRSQEALEAAELRAMDFTHDRSVVSAALQRDITLQKLSEVEAYAWQTSVQIAETAKRVQMLDGKLEAAPPEIISEARTSDNPLLLEKMKSRLLELQLKRTELLTTFQPTYRRVQEVDQQIAETQAAIAAENVAPVREQTVTRDPTHEWARSELMKAQVELSALEARAGANSRVVSIYREAAQRLGDQAVLQEDLSRNLKSAEEKFLLYAGKREEARIGDALDSDRILNVTIAEQPAPPALPARSRLSLVLAGVLGAGVVSTGAAFAADYASPSFRTPDEVVHFLGAPVLASLPRRSELQQ